jgi:outer membrane protein
VLAFFQKLFAVIAAITAFAMPSIAWAQDPVGQPLWEIGVGGLAVSQQAYPGAAANVNRGLVLPFLIYRGEYLRADRGGAGIRALKTSDFELDVGVAAEFGSSSNAVEARQGMPDLGTLVEFGPRLKWHIGAGPGGGRLRLDLPVRGVFDLSDHLARKGLAFEPELIFERRALGGWSYRTGIGALWGDRHLSDTFYGVAPVYANSGRPAYVADSGLIAWRLSASFSRSLSPDLRLFGFAHADTVAGAANESSPLVQRTNGLSVGMALTYTWMRSDSRAAD